MKRHYALHLKDCQQHVPQRSETTVCFPTHPTMQQSQQRGDFIHC